MKNFLLFHPSALLFRPGSNGTKRIIRRTATSSGVSGLTADRRPPVTRFRVTNLTQPKTPVDRHLCPGSEQIFLLLFRLRSKWHPRLGFTDETTWVPNGLGASDPYLISGLAHFSSLQFTGRTFETSGQQRDAHDFLFFSRVKHAYVLPVVFRPWWTVRVQKSAPPAITNNTLHWMLSALCKTTTDKRQCRFSN